MLIKFSKLVSLDDITRFTTRCEKLNVHYKFIQERSLSYLVIESAEKSKIDELCHHFRHEPEVDRIIRDDQFPDPLDNLNDVKIKIGNRWIAHGHKPVIIAGSPYLESQKNALSLAKELASIGVHLYKAGPYRPGSALAPKALYERAGSIIAEINRKAGIPSTGMVETLSTRTALTVLSADYHHVPGELMFETNLCTQLAKMKQPVLLERHPDASTALWIDAARQMVAQGNSEIALVETGYRDGNSTHIDLVEIVSLLEHNPLPLLIYASRPASSAGEVHRISHAALAMGAAGVIIDVHENPSEGLLADGYCLSLSDFRELYTSLEPML